MTPEPVFLLSPPRSCSTVCLAIMAGHPEIYGFPELMAFAAEPQLRTVAALLGESVRRPEMPAWYLRARLAGPVRSVAEVHDHAQDRQALERAHRWLRDRHGWTTIELMDHLMTAVAPRIAVEKSPDTVSSDASLASCLATYPRARFIHLTRHPVSSQASMHRHWAKLGVDPTVLVAQSASAWYLSHLRISRMLAALPPEQWLRVRAEDLVNEPAAHLPRILSWLGLACTPEIIAGMRQTENWIYASFHPGLNGGDPTFMKSPRLRGIALPKDISFDLSWGLSREMCRRMRSLGEYLGY